MGDIIPFSTTPENEKSTKSNEMASNSSGFPEGYALFEDGVYQMPAEELDEAPVLICSPIRVDATFSDQNGKGWGRLITVRNRDSVWIDVSVTNARLERFPSEVVGLLVDAGLDTEFIIPHEGPAHTGLSDAIYQARWVMAAFRRLNQ